MGVAPVTALMPVATWRYPLLTFAVASVAVVPTAVAAEAAYNCRPRLATVPRSASVSRAAAAVALCYHRPVYVVVTALAVC